MSYTKFFNENNNAIANTRPSTKFICTLVAVPILLTCLTINTFVAFKYIQLWSVKPFPQDLMFQLKQFGGNSNDDISCHDVEGKDALSSAEAEKFEAEKNIFFHEASCSGIFNSRQACSVEAAARMNPKWQISVLFSGAIDTKVFKGSTLKTLLTYNNVKLARIHANKYANGTPLESMMSSGVLKESIFRITHTADVMRFLTLFLHPGVHLDLDVLVVKSLDTLASNWVAKDIAYRLDTGALRFSSDSIGRNLSALTVDEIRTNFRPFSLRGNGPSLMNRVMSKVCTTSYFSRMSSKTCPGIEVYTPNNFYPIFLWYKYYEDGGIDIKSWNTTYAHQIKNQENPAKIVPRTCVYAKLAERFCPKIYRLYGDSFGI